MSQHTITYSQANDIWRYFYHMLDQTGNKYYADACNRIATKMMVWDII